MKICRGHLDTVVNMVAQKRYCIDVIHQSQAVQKALKEIDHLILENHLQTCATDAIRKGREKEAVAEVLSVFRKSYP